MYLSFFLVDGARFVSELTRVDRAERNVISFFEVVDDVFVSFYIIFSRHMVIIVALYCGS